jgi:hypothetical protein
MASADEVLRWSLRGAPLAAARLAGRDGRLVVELQVDLGARPAGRGVRLRQLQAEGLAVGRLACVAVVSELLLVPLQVAQAPQA